MFIPKTEKIEKIYNKSPDKVNNFDHLINKNTILYIDYANVKNWKLKKSWHIDIKRLKQFLNCFDNVEKINLYYGSLIGDKKSELEIKKIKKFGYNLITKNVKIMRHSIDVSSISMDSTILISQFIRKNLILHLNKKEIIYLNKIFYRLNKLGKMYIEDRKCNFDVEIGRDMLIDFTKNNIKSFVLFSGDSDFADPINQLLKDGKNIILICTYHCVAKELNQLRKKGLIIFDINNIKNFICRNKEIDKNLF
ncbi:NYN domain-containing protein [Patescibacteria group bacterium]|nr:NYN domain-containing protein [Patescibacteria group bacterium]